jgi:hypothetical protein
MNRKKLLGLLVVLIAAVCSIGLTPNIMRLIKQWNLANQTSHSVMVILDPTQILINLIADIAFLSALWIVSIIVLVFTFKKKIQIKNLPTMLLIPMMLSSAVNVATASSAQSLRYYARVEVRSVDCIFGVAKGYITPISDYLYYGYTWNCYHIGAINTQMIEWLGGGYFYQNSILYYYIEWFIDNAYGEITYQGSYSDPDPISVLIGRGTYDVSKGYNWTCDVRLFDDPKWVNGRTILFKSVLLEPHGTQIDLLCAGSESTSDYNKVSANFTELRLYCQDGGWSYWEEKPYLNFQVIQQNLFTITISQPYYAFSVSGGGRRHIGGGCIWARFCVD